MSDEHDELMRKNGWFYGKDTYGRDMWMGNPFGTSSNTTSIWQPMGGIEIERSRVTCRHCGQWGERETQCQHCGAPMPDDSDAVIRWRGRF